MDMRVSRVAWVAFGRFRAILFTVTLPLASQTTAGRSNSVQGADTTAPCFANNQDILNDRGSLLKDDDLDVNALAANNDLSNPETQVSHPFLNHPACYCSQQELQRPPQSFDVDVPAKELIRWRI
jgi:hypothetical protein